jgi:hypothetical protein
LNDAVEYCRGIGDKLDGANFKNAYFKSFSKSWQDAYLSNGSQNLHTATVDQITAFMTQREAAAYFQKVTNEALTLEHSNSHSFQKRKGDKTLEEEDDESILDDDISLAKKTKRNGNKRRGKNGNGNGNGGGNDKNKTFRPKGTCFTCPDTVPIHPWADCPYNKNNPNNVLARFEKDDKKKQSVAFALSAQTEEFADEPRQFDPKLRNLTPQEIPTWTGIQKKDPRMVEILWNASEFERCGMGYLNREH